MKLTLYLLRKFIGVFIGALFLFTYAMVILDTINNISSYITNKAPIIDILRICMLLTPKSMCMFAPVAVLFSSAYVLSDMYAHNELISVLSGGISLYAFTAPLMLMGMLLTGVFFFFEDKVAVNAFSHANKLKTQYATQKEKDKDAPKAQIVIISKEERVVYDAAVFNEDNNELYDLIVVFRTKDKKLLSLVKAQRAYWDSEESLWKLDDFMAYSLNKGSLEISESLDKSLLELLDESPKTFKDNVTDIEAVDIKTAREHIAYLKRAGLPFTKESVEFYKKFSSPFAIFITILLAIGFSGKTRQNVLIVTLAACIGATVVFYVVQMLTTLLGQFGYIAPSVGAWFPVVLFIAISAILLCFVRT